MAAANYEIVLNNLLSKDIVDECDVLEFIKNLALLTKAIKHQNNRFKTYAPIVKSWIGSYQTIFSDAKISEKALKCINKSCSVTTEIFFNLMQSFGQFEPQYSQELCHHWKEIASRMKGPKRANSFTRHIELFKTIIENLRTAKDRCEQLAILSILKLYIDHVPSDKMTILKERYNKDIVEKLIELKRSPTILNQHDFLHKINAMGRCIISLQPTKIICEQLSFYFNILNYAMWVDFNLRDNSIFYIAVSLIDNTDQCWAVVTGPKIKESMSDEHEIKIRGTWSILRNGETLRKKMSVTTFIPIKDRNPMWKSKLRSIFRFEANTDSLGDSFSQECSSLVTDRRFAYKHPLEDALVTSPSQWSQRYDSDASSSIACLPKNTTLKKLYETSTVPAQQRSNMNSMLATPFQAELKPESPKKCEKDVAGANYSIGDGDKTLLFDDSIDVEQNLTEPMEDKITLTAQKQLDDDKYERMYSAEKVDKAEKQSDVHYLSENVKLLYIPKTSSLLEDSDHSSGISFCNNISVDGEHSEHQNQIEDDKHSEDDWKLSNEKLNTVEEKQIQDIKILEESTIQKHNHRADLDPFSPTPSDTEELNKDVENFIQETDSTQSSPGRSSVSLKLPYNKYAENDKMFTQLKESVPGKAVAEPVFESLSRNSTQKQTKLVGRQNEPSSQSTRCKSVAKMMSPIHKNLQKQNENENLFVQPIKSTTATHERSSTTKNCSTKLCSQKKIKIDDMISRPTEQIDQRRKTIVKSSPRNSYRNESSIELNPSSRNYSQNQKEKVANIFRPWESFAIEKSLPRNSPKNETNIAFSQRDRAQASPNKFLDSPKHDSTQSEDIEMSDKSLTPAREVNNLPLCNEMGYNDMKANHIGVNNGKMKMVSDDAKQPGSNVRVDFSGMVSDDKGCVFFNDEELQSAWDVYIENNGLEYLKTDEFNSLQNYQRERIERELRAIHIMINEGFDVQHRNDEKYQVDQDLLTSDNSIIQTARGTAKRKSQIDSLEEKLPTYASKRAKAMDENKNNGELESKTLPSIANAKATDLATTNDIKVSVPKAIEPNHLNAGYKSRIEECNNSGCNSLVTHLTDLMKKPVETCNPHRRLLMELLQGLQSIELRDHRQLNSTDLAVLMKTTIVAIKSVCNKAAVEAKALSKGV